MLKLFGGGNSQEQGGKVGEALTASVPSASAGSRLFHTLGAEYAVWKARPVAARYQYVCAAGTSFRVSEDGQRAKRPIFAGVGITLTGVCAVLGFTHGERENQPAWPD